MVRPNLSMGFQVHEQMHRVVLEKAIKLWILLRAEGCFKTGITCQEEKKAKKMALVTEGHVKAGVVKTSGNFRHCCTIFKNLKEFIISTEECMLLCDFFQDKDNTLMLNEKANLLPSRSSLFVSTGSTKVYLLYLWLYILKRHCK